MKIFSTVTLVVLMTGTLFFLNKGQSDYSVSDFISDHRSTNHEINKKESGRLIPAIDNMGSSIFSEREKPIMILRIKETYCSSCVDMEMKMVNLFIEVLKDDLYIIVSQSSDRFIRRLFLKNKMKLPYEEIPFNLLSDFEFEKFESPYYFLLHKDLHISNIYVSAKELPKLTEEYIKDVKKLIMD
jgi:hypothetical protein